VKRNRFGGVFPGRATAGPFSEEGVALLMVLWVLTVLMVIVLSFSFMAKTETLATLSFKEGVEKKFLAEAGIERGMVEMLYRRQNLNSGDSELWKTNSTPYSDQLGNGKYTVRIMDESGKLDINTLNDSSAIIFRNLLINSGVKAEDADTITDSVLDWKDADDLHRLHGAESDYYLSLPNPYKAKNADFDTVEELLMVKGMTREILYGTGEKAGIIGFLTVNSKVTTISANAAPRELLMALPGMTAEMADTIITIRTEKEMQGPQDVQAALGASYTLLAPYLGFGASNAFTIDSVGYKDSEKKGYSIKATITIENNNKFRYVYYKSPMNVIQ
jgi:general secretion pathway protein K